jgi:acylphosphatase
MAIRLRITGLVQGVGYRATFQRRAQQLGLSGWVRNCRDGSVEALVDGDAAALADMEAWARHGPPGARVQDVTVEPAMAPDGHAGIVEIKPTA